MLKVLKYLKPYWLMALLAPLAMFLEVMTDLLQPTLMAAIVDRGIAAGRMAFVIHTGIKMVGVALLGIVGGLGCTLAASKASMSLGADLRLDLFRKVQEFSFSNLDDFKASSLITRLTNDVVQVQNMTLMMLRMMVRAPLLCIGGIIMAVSINMRLAAILLIAVPMLAALLTIIVRKGFPLFNSVQQRVDRVNSVMQENLAGIRVIKAFVRSVTENRRFQQANQKLRDINVKAFGLSILTQPVMMLIMNLSIVAVIWFGGSQVNHHTMMVGQVMAFIQYMTQILFSLMMLSVGLTTISRAKASADRINEVLGAQVDIVDSPDALDLPEVKGRVEFRDVSFRFKGAGGEPVLRHVTFTAEPGETVAILGATGAGKSTLVSLIPRLHDPCEGSVSVDGVDVRRIRLSALRRRIGIVLQDTILFTGTIRENLLWGKRNASDEEIREAAEVAQAHEFIAGFPEGYETPLGQMGVNLSGGQKQRLAIARALLKKPAILILDDSTSAVDMSTEARIQKALKERMAGTTCFVIAQRISSVLDADRIIVLDDGKVEAMGTHEELLRESPIYQDIYRSQMGEGAALNA